MQQSTKQYLFCEEDNVDCIHLFFFFFLTEHMVDTPVRDIYKLKTIILACVAKQKETYGAGSVPVDRVQQLAQSVQENFCIYNSTDD